MARNHRRREREARELRERIEAELTVYARLCRSGWFRRTLQLSGDVDAMIEYDAWSAAWGKPEAILRVAGRPGLAEGAS